MDTRGHWFGGAASRPSADTVTKAALQRDAAEQALAEALEARGLEPLDVDPSALVATLAPLEAAVGYLRYDQFTIVEKMRHRVVSTPSLLAYVVLPDSSLHRVELGPLAPIEEAVERWRGGLSASAARGAGGIAAGASAGPGDAADAARRLRELVVDPIRAVTGDARRWHVCLDGVLHLVPLEALPTERGVLGDQIEIRHELSFARLLRERQASKGEQTLLVVGGVAFDAEAGGASIAMAATPPVARSAEERGGVHFVALPGTMAEARAIGETFEEALGVGAQLLEGAAATKAAFAAAAPSARFLHLATHGYFSDANVKVLGEPDRDASHALWQRSSLEETVKGLSPFTLCGLALAGANRGMDSLGRVPGILTAEELMGLDLRHCELAVLSACETHVGLDRGASGIASLQAALHAAGVRTAITSLWKVDDERTRELMVDFYRRLWVGKEPAAVALWNAKKALRAKGAPIRDWSGWILTGDPGDDPEHTRDSHPASAPASGDR